MTSQVQPPVSYWDTISTSTRIQPQPLFDSSTFEESAARFFAFDDLIGEFLNPFTTPAADREERGGEPIETQDAIQAIDELLSEGIFEREKLLTDEPRRSDAISPRTRAGEWLGVVDRRDSSTLGLFEQVSLIPYAESSLEVEIAREISRWSAYSDDDGYGGNDDEDSIHSRPSPIFQPCFSFQLPPWPQVLDQPSLSPLILTLPLKKKNVKTPLLRIPPRDPDPDSSDILYEYLSPTDIKTLPSSASESAFGKYWTHRLSKPEVDLFTPISIHAFPDFLLSIDVDALLSPSQSTYILEDHDYAPFKWEADCFIFIPHPPVWGCYCFHCETYTATPNGVKKEEHNFNEWCYCPSCEEFRDREEMRRKKNLAKTLRERYLDGEIGYEVVLDLMDYIPQYE